MPRRPRLILPAMPLHIIQRGNNRSACFACEADYQVYLSLLQDYAAQTGCDVHAYVLMTNHVHLLLSSPGGKAPSVLMRRLGQHYVQYFNRRHGRTGTLWEGRFRSSLVDADSYLVACHRYIELNPMRAGIVDEPGRYRWSSYHANALGAADSLVTPHALYLGLGAHAQAAGRVPPAVPGSAAGGASGTDPASEQTQCRHRQRGICQRPRRKPRQSCATPAARPASPRWGQNN